MVEGRIPKIVAWETAPYIFAVIAVNASPAPVVARRNGHYLFISGIPVVAAVFIAVSCCKGNYASLSVASVADGIIDCEPGTVGKIDHGCMNRVIRVGP